MMKKISKVTVIRGVVRDVTETEVFTDIEVPDDFEELDMHEQENLLWPYDPQTVTSETRKVLGSDLEDVIIGD